MRVGWDKVLVHISLTKHRSPIRSMSKLMKRSQTWTRQPSTCIKANWFPFIGSYTKILIQLWYLGWKMIVGLKVKITRCTELSFVVGPFRNYIFENNTIQRPLHGWELNKMLILGKKKDLVWHSRNYWSNNGGKENSFTARANEISSKCKSTADKRLWALKNTKGSVNGKRWKEREVYPPSALVKLTNNTLKCFPAKINGFGPGLIMLVSSSFKSGNKIIKKHCELCGFILVGNWCSTRKVNGGIGSVFKQMRQD